MSYWESKGKSDNWYTPHSIFSALECVFDMDVAGKFCAANRVPARQIIESEGLSRDWRGFVWMNPPFGGRNGLEPWLEKFFSHGNGIALTPDRTSAPWFQNAWKKADMVMFTPKVRFLREDGSLGISPSNGTALWAVGVEARLSLRRAELKGLGIVARPTFFHEVSYATT
ncbi:DNA N-6-adenine-methyltransferase [Edaphobacter paludis]|uniref:DNA N-6-adenine-methyltransferase n=1 Tax=Edaphobacter paludis TaxID=3035702 RepID=A0AAU7D7E0_9BACT